MAAWWDGLDEQEREAVLEMPGLEGLPAAEAETVREYSPALLDALLGVLYGSGSDFLVLPIQDVFGWRDRVNVPASQGEHNWTWKLPWPVDRLAGEDQARERAEALRRWSDETGRWDASGHGRG
jgi:4-alpha-glucanotransferase